MANNTSLRFAVLIRFINSKEDEKLTIHDLKDITPKLVCNALMYEPTQNETLGQILLNYSKGIKMWIEEKGIELKWNDGKLFCVLLEHLGIKMNGWQQLPALDRIKYALKKAKENGVPKIITSEEVLLCSDEVTILLYLSNFIQIETGKSIVGLNNEEITEAKKTQLELLRAKTICEDVALELHNNISKRLFEDELFKVSFTGHKKSLSSDGTVQSTSFQRQPSPQQFKEMSEALKKGRKSAGIVHSKSKNSLDSDNEQSSSPSISVVDTPTKVKEKINIIIQEQPKRSKSTTIIHQKKQLIEIPPQINKQEEKKEVVGKEDEIPIITPNTNVIKLIDDIRTKEKTSSTFIAKESYCSLNVKLFGSSVDPELFGGSQRFIQIATWVGFKKCSLIARFNSLSTINFSQLALHKSGVLLIIHVDKCVFGSFVSSSITNKGVNSDRQFFVFSLLNTSNVISKYFPLNYKQSNWEFDDGKTPDLLLNIKGFLKLCRSGSHISKNFTKYFKDRSSRGASIFCERVSPNKFHPTQIALYQFY